MNRIVLPLGLAALLVSFSASAVRVPTGSDDINLNVNAFLQARYEGTFEGSVESAPANSARFCFMLFAW